MILTFQSKQHAPFAAAPQPATGITLLTPGSWPLFRTLQRLTSGVTAVMEKLLRRVLPRGPSADHLVDRAGPPLWSPKERRKCVCVSERSPECDYIGIFKFITLNTKEITCVSFSYSGIHVMELLNKTWTMAFKMSYVHRASYREGSPVAVRAFSGACTYLTSCNSLLTKSYKQCI